MANETIGGDVVQRLLDASTTDELYDASLEVAMRVLDAETCQLVQVDDDELTVLDSTSQTSGSHEPIPVATDIIGQLDLIGRSHVFDDISDVRSVAAPQSATSDDHTIPRSLLVVPIDAIGLLVASSESPGAFDDIDQEWAEQLASFLEGIIEARSEVTGDESEVDRLDRITTILSHDFAGPLTVARGSLELAEETGEAEYFERAHKAIDQIEQLVEGIERLAEADDSYPNPQMVELRSVAEEVWPAIEHEDAALDIVDSRAILADKHALAQLLRNLFSNAVEHGGPDTTVRIGVTDSGFFVEDDGPGVPAEDREVIFSWGYSTGDESKGIGLSIVEQIAEAHDWEISVTEGSLGGARFEITDIGE